MDCFFTAGCVFTAGRKKTHSYIGRPPHISPEAWYSRRSQYQLITGIPRILIKPMENHHSRDALGHHEIPYKTNGKPSFPRFHVIRFETTSRLPQALVRSPPRTARYQVWEDAFHSITKHLETLKSIGGNKYAGDFEQT